MSKTITASVLCIVCDKTVVGDVSGVDRKRVAEEVELNSIITCRKCQTVAEKANQ